MIGMGGSVFVSSGRSDDGTSGAASIETSPSGPNGVSGAVRIASGSSTAGDSGAMFVGTGDSKFGAGGTVRIRVGDAGFKDGGDAILQAGQASAQGAKGGSVVLAGGEGSSTHTTDGGEASSFRLLQECPSSTHCFSVGDGGGVMIKGGESKGDSPNDRGGDVKISGGASSAGLGGSLEFKSGYSTETTSGSVCKYWVVLVLFAQSRPDDSEHISFPASQQLPVPRPGSMERVDR